MMREFSIYYENSYFELPEKAEMPERPARGRPWMDRGNLQSNHAII